jgi:hypothetical protein
MKCGLNEGNEQVGIVVFLTIPRNRKITVLLMEVQ